MNLFKKIFYSLIAVFCSLALGLLIYFAVTNIDSAADYLSGATLYTKSQVDDAYNDGLKISNDKLLSYQTQLDSCKNQIALLTSSNISYIEKIDLLSSENAYKQAQIEELEHKVSTLTDDLTYSNNQNLYLNNKINELSNKITDLESQIYQNETTILNLESQIDILQNDITVYIDLVNSMKDVDQYIVTFKHNNYIFDLKVVNSGTKITDVPIPVDTDYVKFINWKLNNAVVDVFSIEITSNIVFVSTVENYYLQEFYIEDELYYSTIVLLNSKYITPVINNTDDYIFDKWYLNGYSGSFSSSVAGGISATANSGKNMKYYARFLYYYDVNFYDFDKNTILFTERILEGNAVSESHVLVYSGYDFIGWSDVDNINITYFVNVLGNKIYKDTNYYPYFKQFYIVDFVYSDNGINEISHLSTKHYVGQGLIVSNIPTPIVNGCRFLGWQVDDEYINPLTYSYMSNTKVIAMFTSSMYMLGSVIPDGDNCDIYDGYYTYKIYNQSLYYADSYTSIRVSGTYHIPVGDSDIVDIPIGGVYESGIYSMSAVVCQSFLLIFNFKTNVSWSLFIDLENDCFVITLNHNYVVNFTDLIIYFEY